MLFEYGGAILGVILKFRPQGRRAQGRISVMIVQIFFHSRRQALAARRLLRRPPGPQAGKGVEQHPFRAQIVAGPILRRHSLLPQGQQIRKPREMKPLRPHAQSVQQLLRPQPHKGNIQIAQIAPMLDAEGPGRQSEKNIPRGQGAGPRRRDAPPLPRRHQIQHKGRLNDEFLVADGVIFINEMQRVHGVRGFKGGYEPADIFHRRSLQEPGMFSGVCSLSIPRFSYKSIVFPCIYRFFPLLDYFSPAILKPQRKGGRADATHSFRRGGRGPGAHDD